MTLDEAIERNRRIANSYKDTVPDCDVAREHAQLADWLEELRDRRAAEQDSLDAMCSQIEKVVRTESDDGDWYAALLRDGSWVHFHTMNDVLRRFIFDSKHCQHSGVTFSGQTEYTR